VVNIFPLQECAEMAYLLVIKNVTSQQQLKYQLQSMQEARQLYDLILDEMEEGICAIDLQGKILFYNRKMGEIDLREPESVKGRRIFDVWPNVEENTSTLFTSIKLERTLNHRETHFTSTGKAITTLSRTFPLYIGEKKAGAVEITRDITEQKTLTETIQQLQNQKMPSKKEEQVNQKQNHTRFQFTDIIFSSREMRQTIEHARSAARSASNVLLIGETGTGKELFAQSIHNASPRRSFPFIAQNCAALPENLLEGILFGTSVGGFTGAVEREGLFEQAQGGTLLLDEINSMGLNLQAKLLRVLQEKKVQRIGSSKVRDVDVRIMATINEDPFEAIEKKKLREDLFYRLSVVNITIPPLRKRKEDIPSLIKFFLKKHARSLNVEVEDVEKDVYDLFLSYSWPGNVRQLEHTIEGCLNLIHDENKITFEHLPHAFKDRMLEQASYTSSLDRIEGADWFRETLDEQVEQLERFLIGKALQEAEGNITKAGEKLGISRQNLRYKIKKYKL
jgi:arginine utilization regulatory protein